MSTKNNDANKKMLLSTINEYDTIKDFMEKCNSNFLKISQNGGGPAGVQGEEGSQGAPTKPKVPIHVWKKGKEEDGCQYQNEITTQNGFEINEWYEDLSNSIYQNGHLIILENGHVYILKIDETDNFTLKPNYIISLQTYDPSDVTDGENAYVHIAYTNNIIDFDGFETDQELRREKIESGEFNLIRTLNDIIYSDKPYIGIYTDNLEMSSKDHDRYTWIKVKGDSFTGHPYVIDLEGNMSTISIDIDRTRLYDTSDDFCECILHAYYGNKIEKINTSDVEIILPDEYKYLDDNNIVLKSDESNVGTIEKIQSNNDVIIKFIPDENFVFPKKTINFSIHIETTVYDEDDKNVYDFARDVVWMIKGIMSTFELEIVPEYKTIKLFENGEYYPEKLHVDVYKVEDAERTKFDFSQNTDFKLLYKNVYINSWSIYPSEGINPINMSGIEFKVVRYYGTENEEMWDHEDVWVVADGKGTHYYHADLGATESMMVLTTGEKTNVGTEKDPKYCAELRNESGYSITFDPKFYDGSTEIENSISSVNINNIGKNSGEQYVEEGTFERELNGLTLTITKVPYGVEVIPMTIDVTAVCPTYDNFGNVVEYISKTDTVSFNVYITTISDTYTLIPTVSSYNTSTGKDGDKIGCSVYKNTTLINTEDLNENGLSLYYIVYNGETGTKTPVKYSEPLVYGADDDNIKDEFNASDVSIEFILKYRNKEVVKSTVPLIKDGKNGEDGNLWQYIFCRAKSYPFETTNIIYPSQLELDGVDSDPDNELIPQGWDADHKGVDIEYKYEYQSYRKWDKKNKCWGKYGEPTLYSNFSENGIGYTVILSNPVSVIPVGDDNWKPNEDLQTQADSTLVYLYNNTKDISKDTNVSIKLQNQEDKYVKNGNFSIEKENGINKVVFRPVVNNSTFDFVGNTQYKLPIIITYDLGEGYDKFETTTNWTLTPARGLEDVEVFVDKRVVNTTKKTIHNLEVGYYLTSSSGNKKIVKSKDPQDNIKKYDIKLTDDIGNINNATIVQNWANAEYDFKDGNCYVVLVESDGNTIVDYVNVTAVNDGKEGENRVLFYLGSFQDGSLTGQTVKGRLNKYRCDYYIDVYGKAWMRSGTPDENPDGYDGQMDGTKNDTNYWKQSENVDFLKASAIHADMINVNSLVANKAFINNIKAIEISADKIKTGTISSDGGKSYFNLENGEFVLGKTESGGAALEYKNGTLTIGGVNDDSADSVLNRLGAVESSVVDGDGLNLLKDSDFKTNNLTGFFIYDSSEEKVDNAYTFSYDTTNKCLKVVTTKSYSKLDDTGYRLGFSAKSRAISTWNGIKAEENYMLSFDVWASQETDMRCYIGYGTKTTKHIGKEKTRFVAPIKHEYTDTTYYQNIFFLVKDICTFYIDNIKLEKGTKATDWTPASEDALEYLKTALANETDITGGIVATTSIQLRDKDVVNAGISGVKDDNILLWGGGTYNDAYNAANSDTYNTGSGTITTLIKKNGTGKIGIFEISETQAVIDVPNQGKVIIDSSENNGGIRVLNSSGEINAALLPTSISSFKPLADKTTHSDEKKDVYYSMDTQSVTSTSKTITLTRNGKFTQSGTTEEKLEQYNKKTTITTNSTKIGGNTVTLNGDIITSNHSMFVKITCELLYNGISISSIDLTEEVLVDYNYISLSDVNISFPNSIPKELTVSNSINMQLKVTVTTTSGGGYIDAVSLKVSMEPIYMYYKATTKETYTYHPQTIIGSDGLISLVSNNKYFMVDNSGSTQKIFAKGLGASQGDPGSGELYVTSDFIDAFKAFVTKAKELFAKAKYVGTGDTDVRDDANTACNNILKELDTTSIIANS